MRHLARMLMIAQFLLVSTVFIPVDAEARKRSRKIRNSGSVDSRWRHLKAESHNSNFMNSCSKTKPTVYNPRINNSMQGGKKNRMGENVISVEEAARTGRPVTVAMDHTGVFGEKCNWKSKNGRSTRRCMLLVHLPGLDQVFPAYGKRFPNLPKDSILAIVEDTGGAFRGRGTGKMDIPFDNTGSYFSRAKPGRKVKNLHVANEFGRANFEVLDTEKFNPATNAGARRHQSNTSYKPFLGDQAPKCSWHAARATVNAPSVFANAPTQDSLRELSDYFQSTVGRR